MKRGNMEKEKVEEEKEKEKVKNDAIKTSEAKKKYELDKDRLLHIIINFIIYFVILFIKDEKSAILILLVIMPIALAINSFIYGFKTRGCDSIYSFLSTIILAPFILIKFDNTYCVYILMYLSFMIISNVIGSFISNLRKRPDGCTDIGCNCKWGF